MAVAEAAGLNVERLQRDMTDPGIAAILSRNRALAKALDISGTPTYVIDDRLISGTADAALLEDVIAEVRKNKGHS
jgi:predicted DsbA family dithiol-disulfide isomerase